MIKIKLLKISRHFSSYGNEKEKHLRGGLEEKGGEFA